MNTNSTDISSMIVEGIRDRKGHAITLIDTSAIESCAASKFIICEGSSVTQVASIADSVRDYLLEHGGIKPYNYDGYRNSEWIVIDYGDVFVNVFLPEARRRYNLEELWSDGIMTELPD